MPFSRDMFKELLRAGRHLEAFRMAGALGFTEGGVLVFGIFKPSDEVLSAVLEEIDAARRDGLWPPSRNAASVTLTLEPDVLALLQRLPAAIERGVAFGVLAKPDAELLAQLLQRALKVV